MINQKKLLSLMVLKGLSRKQLSVCLNCSYQTLTKKINCKAAFKDHELKKLSELLDVSINELYD
ncbi:MAG: helix-turn-helix transcriptional regulator [Acholeplasma sp.]|nr:helix-turn-helix transcriptional regulator [Acholeplasma sp.]